MEWKFQGSGPNGSQEPIEGPGVVVVESGKADIEPDDAEEMLKARLPLNNNPKKASYLTYRASGFSVRESCTLSEISWGTVLRWRREDEEFREWEQKRLPELQHSLVGDLIRMEFLRNFRLALRRDFKLLYKANYNLHGMSDREYDLLKVIRKHYAPQDLIAIQKALEPDEGELLPGGYRETLTVTVEGRRVDDESARRAAARSLLERFEVNRQLVAPEELEGLPDGEQKALTGEVL